MKTCVDTRLSHSNTPGGQGRMHTHTGDREWIGAFEIVKTLGQGGMAELLIGRDGVDGEEVAIKRVLPALRERAEMISMFRDEARLAARLAHPNLVRARAIGD